jgi:uncharacterized phage infection (PIP) family protein YhgE
MKIELSIELQESLKGLRDVSSAMESFKQHIASARGSAELLNEATARLASTTAYIGTPADILQTKLGSVGNTLERLQNQANGFQNYLDKATDLTPELSEYWQYVNRDVQSSTDSVRQFAEQARAAAAATQTIIIDTATQKVQTPKPVQGFELVKLASAALAVKAIGGVANAMTTARTAIANIDTTKGKERIETKMQVDYTLSVRLKGYTWDETNGGKSPTDAEIATGSNWDRVASSVKHTAGVIVTADAAQ